MMHSHLLIVTLSFWPMALAAAAEPGCEKATWETLSGIPVAPRQEQSVVGLSDTTLAIIGGIIPNPDGPGFNTTDILQLYDIPSDTWRSGAPAPIEVNHPNVAAVNGRLYLLGGLSVASNGTWKAFPESWVYDPATDEWSSLDPIPAGEERGSAAMGVYGSIVYMAGGMRTLEPIGPGGEQDTVEFVSAFDTETSSWLGSIPEAARTIPEGRDHAAASVVDGRFYVLGGRLCGQHNVKDTTFVLDLTKPEEGWRTSEGRMPTARGGVVSGTVDGKVFVMGGEGNPAEGTEGIFDQVEVFDARTETWEIRRPMSLPRHGGQAVAIGGGIYLPGGGVTEGASPVNVTDVYWP